MTIINQEKQRVIEKEDETSQDEIPMVSNKDSIDSNKKISSCSDINKKKINIIKESSSDAGGLNSLTPFDSIGGNHKFTSGSEKYSSNKSKVFDASMRSAEGFDLGNVSSLGGNSVIRSVNLTGTINLTNSINTNTLNIELDQPVFSSGSNPTINLNIPGAYNGDNSINQPVEESCELEDSH